MFKRIKQRHALYLRLILCSFLVLGIAACSDDDDDDGTDTEMQSPDDEDDGDDDAVQESIDENGLSTFIVPLSGEQEVPPVDSGTAAGEGNLEIARTGGGAISGSVSVSELTGPATAAHIHRGFGGINGDVVFGLTGNEDGSLWTVPADTVLTTEQLTALSEGEMYINVHTEANPGGEIRGQIIPIGILFEDSELSGDEEVPPVVTDASGVGVSTVNFDTGAISATIILDGLDDATMAHIHMGAEGENGDVVITLEQDVDNPGIWRTPIPSMLSAEQIEMYENEALYFNVHSADHPSGEIRGQL